MLSSLVQDLLGATAEVSHAFVPVIHRNLWPVILANSKRRLRQLYHIPEPITVRNRFIVLHVSDTQDHLARSHAAQFAK
jgi:hypothetical protein